MFERFTDRARRVLTFAQEEARLLNHSFIGTEHILLGLLREGEGLGATALHELGIFLDSAREQVEEIVGPAGTVAAGSPPFTPRAKKVLELSLREALQMSHSYIGTEHILLGLAREGEGVAATVLVNLGADLGGVRQEVIKLMSGGRDVHGGVLGELASKASEEEAPPREPSCPRCRGSVSETARVRTISVQPDETQDDPMSIAVVYCAQCGTTLHMLDASRSS